MSLQKSSYFAHTDTRESARLIREGDLISKQIGSLFPKRFLPERVQRVLDIACGPGGWALDVAAQNPSIEVVGIDNSVEMLEQARSIALAEKIENVTFLEMDARSNLLFPDESFDFVNGRFWHTFLHRDQWPMLLSESLRLLSPGGIARITEFETGFSTTPVVDACNRLYAQAMYAAGYSFSSDGRGLCFSPFLLKFFQEVGLVSVEHCAHALDCSSGANAAQGWMEEFVMLFQAAIPVLLSTGVISQERLDELFLQAIAEVMSTDFFALTYFFEIWGEKPGRNV